MNSIPPGTDLSKIPLQANPSGAPPNFVDPPNLIDTVRGVGIFLAVITLILLVSRLTIYIKINRGLVIDDVSVIIAFILAVGYSGMVCSTERLSRHAWDTPLSFLDSDYEKKLLVTSVFYGPMLFFAKAAILLLYHRAFRPKVWLRMGVYISLAILFGSYFMTVPLAFIYCMPHHGKPWDLNVIANCDHLATPGLVQGGINIAADIFIFILPLPVIFKLQIPMSKKIALSAVFATGFFALTASVLTMYYRVRIVRGFDATWAGAQTYICIQAEIYAAICVACMPSLAKVWKIKFTETKIYAGLQSLLHSMRGSQSTFNKSRESKGDSSNHSDHSGHSDHSNNHSNRHSHDSNETLAESHKDQPSEYKLDPLSFSSTRRGSEDNDQSPELGGIYRMVTVDLTSHRLPEP